MLRKIISMLMCFVLVFTSFPSVIFAVDAYSFPVIYPVVDTYVRKGKTDNFSSADRMVVDNSSGNHRFVLVEFDLSGYTDYVSSASKIKFTLCSHTDGGSASSDNRYVVIPLKGDYKNIDVENITYSVAQTIMSDGVALTDYMPEGLTEYRSLASQYIDIDVTDYCKNEADGRIILMVKSVSGAYSFLPTENPNLGVTPRLTIENDYTGIENDAYNTAQYVFDMYDGIDISHDVDFVTEHNGFSISYDSLNPEYVLSNGRILKRPDVNEASKGCSFKMYVTSINYPNVYEEREFSLNVLNNASVSGTYTKHSDRLEIAFNGFTTESGKKTLLKIPITCYEKGTELSVSQNGENLLRFVCDGIKNEYVFDVTNYADNISSSPFVISGTDFSVLNPKTSVISTLEPEAASAVMELYTYALGDMSNVTEDIPLPDEVSGFNVSWESSNRAVLSNSGRVERPQSKDEEVKLTSVLSGDNVYYTLGMFVNIVRVNTSVENNAYPELIDPMYMSDESLFGKWNSYNGIWDEAPVLRYDLYDGLKNVEASVKKGDYATAKQELLAYYRLKGGDDIYTLDPASDYDVKADAMNDKIWSYGDNDNIQAQGYVSTELGWQTIELTHLGTLTSGTFWIMDADMDGSYIEIYSKERDASYVANIEITVSGKTYTYPAISDTYISGGVNMDINYGNEQILYCREQSADSVTPISSDTKRPYFKFEITDAFSATPSSVTLNFYGKAIGDKQKKVYLFKSSILKSHEEDSLTWKYNGSTRNYIEAFNFKQTGFVWLSVAECMGNWLSEFEWTAYSTRLYQTEWLLSSYLRNNNEDYAYRAFELAMSQYTQKPDPQFPRNLESGWRSENIIRLIYTGINSQHMTEDVFIAMLKWLYSHYDALKDEPHTSTANQNNAVKANVARMCAFFPELIPDGGWEDAKAQLVYFYSNGLMNEDGSYTESCVNYIAGVIEEMAGVVDIVKARDGETHEDYLYFKNQLHKLITYFSSLSFSLGKSVPYGDGGRSTVINTVRKYNKEYIGDKELEFIATMGVDGTEPTFTSQIYPQKAVCMMRSGWHKDDLCAFLNNDNGGSHGHADELSLDVTAFGDYLLVDAGVSTYSPGVNFTDLRDDTLLHNTIMIDNRNQTHLTLNTPGFMDFKTNKSFDRLHAATTYAYSGFDMHRKVLMLKNKYIIVSDYIYNTGDSNPHDYSVLWHPDYNLNLQLDSATGAAQTRFDDKSNIKIIPADNSAEAEIFQRWMVASSKGVTQSKSVRYNKNAASGNQSFDTVLYPQDENSDDDVSVSRISLSCEPIVATAMKININDNTGYYYSSNEETPSQRSFDTYTFSGEMAYVEKDNNENVSYIAITGAKEISDSGKKLVSSDNTFDDFSAIYDTTRLKLYSSKPLVSAVSVAVNKTYSSVTLNGQEVAFICENGFVTTDGSPKSDNSDSSTDSGVPSSPIRDNSFGGSSAGGGVVIPPAQCFPFEDSKDHWAREYIESLYKEGIISGMDESTFAPEAIVTRAQLTKLIAQAAGLEVKDSQTRVFNDVASGEWYTAFINAAYSAGVINGYEDGSFKPDVPVTRQEMSKILCIAADIMNLPHNEISVSFADHALIDDWAKDYVASASSMGLFSGDERNFFNPHNNATRAEAAAVIYRLINYMSMKGVENSEK